MWCLFFLPARLPRSGKLPVLSLVTGQKSGFYAPQGRLVTPIQVKLGRADGHLGPRGCAKFHLNQRRGWECGPKISKFPRFAKESPRRGELFDRILKSVGDFIRLSIQHQCFKFHFIRLTDNGVIAEKPRVGQLRRIFRAPYRKLYTLDLKMNDTFFDSLDELYQHAKFGEDRTTRAVCRSENVVFVFAARRRYAYCVLATATCLAGWLGVYHSRYCIKTTKPILELFQPSGSPIIEAFGTPCAVPNSKGNPFIGGYIYTRWRFSTEIAVYLVNGHWCEVGRWLQWNVKRMSWVPDRLV